MLGSVLVPRNLAVNKISLGPAITRLRSTGEKKKSVFKQRSLPMMSCTTGKLKNQETRQMASFKSRRKRSGDKFW